MRWLIDLGYLLGSLAYLPFLVYSALVHGKNRRGWGERFGGVARRDACRPRVWVHAVSLGEVNATPRLVEALRQASPDADIVVSTTTDTGFARAVELYGREAVFRFPLDFSLVISRVLRRIRPTLIVLVELEVWPNLIEQASRAGIPVAVVNGRLTARSAQRFGWLGHIARRMFGRLSWVGAQDEAIAARFRNLGVLPERVAIVGSMKWDTAVIADTVPGAEQLAAEMGLSSDRPIWVCGSTGPGEETLLLQAYCDVLEKWRGLARGVQVVGGGGGAVPALVLVPRKPERFEEAAQLIQRGGFHPVRRSEPTTWAPGPVSTPRVVLGDTLGELRKFYALADIVFVGRSLVPLGGSDPMEVAALGRPMVVGPHTDNFAAPIEALLNESACVRVSSIDELSLAVLELLTDRDRARAMGMRGQELARRHQGATRRMAAALQALMADKRCPAGA